MGWKTDMNFKRLPRNFHGGTYGTPRELDGPAARWKSRDNGQQEPPAWGCKALHRSWVSDSHATGDAGLCFERGRATGSSAALGQGVGLSPRSGRRSPDQGSGGGANGAAQTPPTSPNTRRLHLRQNPDMPPVTYRGESPTPTPPPPKTQPATQNDMTRLSAGGPAGGAVDFDLEIPARPSTQRVGGWTDITRATARAHHAHRDPPRSGAAAKTLGPLPGHPSVRPLSGDRHTAFSAPPDAPPNTCPPRRSERGGRGLSGAADGAGASPSGPRPSSGQARRGPRCAC